MGIPPYPRSSHGASHARRRAGTRADTPLRVGQPEGAKDKAVEIGAYAGEGTVILANHFKEVTSVDPWINGYDGGTWPASKPR